MDQDYIVWNHKVGVAETKSSQCKVLGFCLDPRTKTYKEGVYLSTDSNKENMCERKGFSLAWSMIRQIFVKEKGFSKHEVWQDK